MPHNENTALNAVNEHADLIADLQRLDGHHKNLAREFIRMLTRVAKPSEFADRAHHFANAAHGIATHRRDNAAAAVSSRAVMDAALGASV